MTTVTSIGIGNMGAALASTLLASPNPPTLTIWNRTPDRPLVKSLISQGASFQPSLATAIARSTTLLICLLDYPSLTSALTTLPPTALAGKTIINLTNGTPNEARAMASHLKRLGAAAYFDGGIMVTPQLVGTPASFIVLSGESEARFTSSVADSLKPIGAVQYIPSDDVGAASLYDVAALTAMYGMFMGVFTGMALLKKQRQQGAEKEGGEKVLAKPATDAVMMPVLKALVPYVSLLAECVDKEDWMNDLGNPLAMQAAGVRNILQTCEEEGVDGAGMQFISQLMNRGVEEGFGAGGVATIAKYLFK